MAIKYFLRRNPFKTVTEYYAATIPSGTVYLDDIIKLALKRGSTVTETDLRVVMHLFMEVVADALSRGHRIITPIFQAELMIKGKSLSADDSFDPKRHTLTAKFQAGPLIKTKLKEAKFKRVQREPRLPRIQSVHDLESKTETHILEPGQFITIKGHELKFDPTDTDQGVWLIANSGQAYPIQTIFYHTRFQIQFRLPTTIPSGRYSLEVRAIMRFTTELRTGTFKSSLTVK